MDGENNIKKAIEAKCDEVDGYLSSLRFLREALSRHDPGLPARCEEFAERWQSLSGETVTRDWPRIYPILSSCSVAITQGYVIDQAELEKRKKIILKYGYDSGPLNAFSDFVLSPIRVITSLLTIGWARYKCKKRAEYLRKWEHDQYRIDVTGEDVIDDIQAIEKRLTELNRATEEIEESQKVIEEANEEPTPSPPPEVSAVKQEAFVQFNETLTNVAMAITVTMKIGNRPPVTLQTPEMKFNLPEENKPVPNKPIVGVVEVPRLAVGQLAEHNRVCDEIALELELWRKEKLSEYKNEYGKNTIVEPSAKRLARRINTRHKNDEGWTKLSDTKVTRNLEYALGVKIDIAKYMSAHRGNRPNGYKPTARETELTQKMETYGRADILLMWAGLSLRNIDFAKADAKDIAKITALMKTDLCYERAMELVCQRWY